MECHNHEYKCKIKINSAVCAKRGNDFFLTNGAGVKIDIQKSIRTDVTKE